MPTRLHTTRTDLLRLPVIPTNVSQGTGASAFQGQQDRVQSLVEALMAGRG
jgi:hypothetical protein